MKFILQSILLFAVLTFQVVAQEPEIKNMFSRVSIVRLKPSEFKSLEYLPKMPKHIASYLEQQNCTIPQSYSIKNHHNAFQGEFVKKGQSDWAVLCSRNNTSSILLFWKGSIKNVSQFASYPDESFMKAVDPFGKVGFFRVIGKDTKKKLSKTDEILFGDILPKFDNWGIDEQLPDGKYVIYYIYKHQFVVLDNDIGK